MRFNFISILASVALFQDVSSAVIIPDGLPLSFTSTYLWEAKAGVKEVHAGNLTTSNPEDLLFEINYLDSQIFEINDNHGRKLWANFTNFVGLSEGQNKATNWSLPYGQVAPQNNFNLRYLYFSQDLTKATVSDNKLVTEISGYQYFTWNFGIYETPRSTVRYYTQNIYQPSCGIDYTLGYTTNYTFYNYDPVDNYYNLSFPGFTHVFNQSSTGQKDVPTGFTLTNFTNYTISLATPKINFTVPNIRNISYSQDVPAQIITQRVQAEFMYEVSCNLYLCTQAQELFMILSNPQTGKSYEYKIPQSYSTQFYKDYECWVTKSMPLGPFTFLQE